MSGQPASTLALLGDIFRRHLALQITDATCSGYWHKVNPQTAKWKKSLRASFLPHSICNQLTAFDKYQLIFIFFNKSLQMLKGGCLQHMVALLLPCMSLAQ